MKIHKLLLLALLVIGCNRTPIDHTNIYSNKRFGYEVTIPKGAWSEKNTPSDEIAGFGTFSLLEKEASKNDYQISIKKNL